MSRFFTKIESSLGWLKPVTLAEYISLEEPLGRVYLPTTSYMEMGEWSLPAESARSYAELIEELKRYGDDAQRVFRFCRADSGGTSLPSIQSPIGSIRGCFLRAKRLTRPAKALIRPRERITYTRRRATTRTGTACSAGCICRIWRQALMRTS